MVISEFPCHYYHLRSYKQWICHFLFCQDFGLFNVPVSNMYKILKKKIEQIITQKLSTTTLFHFQQFNNRLQEYEYINKILKNKKWLLIMLTP